VSTALKRRRGIESVSRALDLLEVLACEELGLVDLSRKTGLQPSTTHRLLATLRARGYVWREESGRYVLGYRLLRLGSSVERRNSALTSVARPYMERIRKLCGEAVYLTVLDGADIVYLDQLLQESAPDMLTVPGLRAPAHASALGKAMLAFSAPDVVAEAFQEERLERFTDRTITDRGRLMQELEAVRKRGFALNLGEFQEGITCIAAPIFDETERAVGALSVSGPTLRMRRVASLGELGELVGTTAIEASWELGYHGQSRWHHEPLAVGHAS
jgi:DNA-binding IclR family transcriptional regulator